MLAIEKPLLRRLDDAAVVFDARTWQTHLLPPASAAVVDLVEELAVTSPVSVERLSAALRSELDLDPEAPDLRQLLRMLAEIGILDR